MCGGLRVAHLRRVVAAQAGVRLSIPISPGLASRKNTSCVTTRVHHNRSRTSLCPLRGECTHSTHRTLRTPRTRVARHVPTLWVRLNCASGSRCRPSVRVKPRPGKQCSPCTNGACCTQLTRGGGGGRTTAQRGRTGAGAIRHEHARGHRAGVGAGSVACCLLLLLLLLLLLCCCWLSLWALCGLEESRPDCVGVVR